MSSRFKILFPLRPMLASTPIIITITGTTRDIANEIEVKDALVFA